MAQMKRHTPARWAALPALVTAVCLSQVACVVDNAEPSGPTQTAAQTVIVWASRGTAGGAFISGLVVGDSMPRVISVAANGGAPVTDFDTSSIGRDSLSFTLRDSVPLVGGSVTVRVLTGLGALSGTVAVPGPMSTFWAVPAETIAVRQSVTVGWPGGGADFYEFGAHYTGVVGHTAVVGRYWSATIRNTTFSFPGDSLEYDGVLGVAVTPMNGPFPFGTGTPNMTGTGTGYLYGTYVQYSVLWGPLSISIQIGAGQ